MTCRCRHQHRDMVLTGTSANQVPCNLRSLVRSATLAPSSHNTQPWRFGVKAGVIDLFADRSRALPINDPADRELTISCGCALLNLRIAAASRGFATVVKLMPEPTRPDWLASMALTISQDSAIVNAELAAQIERRRTRRQRFNETPVARKILNELTDNATVEGAGLKILCSPQQREALARLVVRGDAIQWADPQWRRELAFWLRSRRSGDGLYVPAAVTPIVRWAVCHINFGKLVGKRNQQLAETAPVLAVLATEGDGPSDRLIAGQALQRVLLTASKHDLQASYLNQPVQSVALRPEVQKIIQAGQPQIVMCLGFGAITRPTSRRSTKEVLMTPGEEG